MLKIQISQSWMTTLADRRILVTLEVSKHPIYGELSAKNARHWHWRFLVQNRLWRGICQKLSLFTQEGWVPSWELCTQISLDLRKAKAVRKRSVSSLSSYLDCASNYRGFAHRVTFSTSHTMDHPWNKSTVERAYDTVDGRRTLELCSPFLKEAPLHSL